MQNLQITEHQGIRVLTSRQIAEAYQTTTDTIKTNFNANRCRFVEGKHYISLMGDELKAFKKQVRNPYLVANRASHLYLWTEKGALLHAKSLNTDQAWEVYDWLVDFYFRAKDEKKSSEVVKASNSMQTVVDIPENPKILSAIEKLRNDLICMDVLLGNCIKYTDESTYYDHRKAAADVVNIIISDTSNFLLQQPNFVQKYR